VNHGSVPPPGPVASERNHVFDLLFTTYYSVLVSYVARLVGSYDIGEDIVTDAFVALYDRPERWEPEETARRFLYRVAHNAAIDVIRTTEVRSRVLQGILYEDEIPGGSDPSSNKSTLEQTELLKALDKAIQALPEKRRAVVTLRLEQGLRNAEIAELLNVTTKTVELHLSLALRDLRKALRDFRD
jgi:RNA polymerase sigma-70 factor (ECF subfamily)